MRHRVTLAPMILMSLAVAATACGQAPAAEQQTPSDNEIRLLIVRATIAAYDGDCPCPDSVNARGARCGGNSAYSRGGGYRPLCAPKDVSDAMVRRYREALAKP